VRERGTASIERSRWADQGQIGPIVGSDRDQVLLSDKLLGPKNPYRQFVGRLIRVGPLLSWLETACLFLTAGRFC
jgi:hypothetical protein